MPLRILFIFVVFAVGVTAILGRPASGQPAGEASPDAGNSAAAPAITLAIYYNQPVSSELMSALMAELESELASGSSELQVLLPKSLGSGSGSALAAGPDQDFQIQIISQDSIQPGLRVNQAIVVYLLGDCRIVPRSTFYSESGRQVSGALGWVQEVHGRVEPFVHVDCAKLAAMLASRSLGSSPAQRNQVMAKAIARVIIHEWIHIATQNPGHARHGIGQAQFSVNDLIAPICAHEFSSLRTREEARGGGDDSLLADASQVVSEEMAGRCGKRRE
jgi:hypothetical protein